MDLDYFYKSQILQKHNKIFNSTFNLNYKNKKIEAKFQKISELNYEKSYLIFVLILMFKSFFLTLFEGILYWNEAVTKSKNLKYNFLMCVGVTFLSAVLLISQMIFDKTKNKIYKYVSMFLLHFLLEKTFLSIISIVIVYFQLGIEIVSFTFLMKIITNFLIALLVFRKFTVTLFILVINTVFNHVFLLRIHVIKAILYYIVTDTAFLIIIISFVYMIEYLTRMYFYSFIRLAREKEYILETLNSFNVSYFMSFNYDLIDHTKLEKILIEDTPKGKLHLSKIENLFNNVIAVENISPEIEYYFSELIKNKKPFEFKKLIKILKRNPGSQEKFRKFANFSTFRLKNEMNEYFYVQLYLKIKIKKRMKESANNLFLFLGESEFEESEPLNAKTFTDVKIEGIFLNITQSYMKKESQFNSSNLLKYIDDLKCSLGLFNQIINNNKPIHENSKEKMFRIQPTFNPKFLEQNQMVQNNINELSKYKKIVYKNLVNYIEIIENFTKKQSNSYNENKRTNSDYNCANVLEKVNLRKVIHFCINFFQIYIKFNQSKKNITLIADIDPHIPNYIHSNKLSIKHVIMNLLSNAVKFTYCGEVKIMCKLKSKIELDEKQFIEIAVIDSGVGIEHDNLLKICKPFGLSTIRQGDGLGLYIVNELLEEFDSKLSIQSVKNKGSSFSFILPLDPSSCFKELEIDLNSSVSSTPSSIDGKYEYNAIDVLELKSNLIHSENKKEKDLLYQEENSENTAIYDLPIVKCDTGYNMITPDFNNVDKLSDDFETLSDRHSTINIGKIASNLINSSKLAKHSVKAKEKTTKHENKSIAESEASFGYIKNFSANLTMKILVVHDNREYHKKIMDKMNQISKEIKRVINTTCCYNPLEAINIIYESFKRKEYFELILCDEYTPFMTGSNFAKVYKNILVVNGLYHVIFASLSDNSTNCELQDEYDAKNKHYFDYFLSNQIKAEEILLIMKENH